MKRTAIILAGGQSRRMGQNKAFLSYKETSFIEEIIDKFRDFDERIIVANDVSLYQFEGVITIQDIYPNRGPLCGLYTGLREMSSDRAVVVTVDTPMLTVEVLEYLWTLAEGVDCVVPVVEGRHQSLCAVYNRSSVDVLQAAVENDERKVRLVLDRLKMKEVPEAELKEFGDVKTLFSNVNTPADYVQMKK